MIPSPRPVSLGSDQRAGFHVLSPPAGADLSAVREPLRALQQTEVPAGRWRHERLVRWRARSTSIRAPRAPQGTRFVQDTEVRTRLDGIFCGIDWSERHHDVALVDTDGNQVAKAAHQRRQRWVPCAARPAGPARRQHRAPDSGGHRDTAGSAAPVPACHRSQGLRDQPARRRPLPGSCQRCSRQVRRRRRPGVGQHPAHRPPRPPSAARGQRTGPSLSRCWPARTRTRSGIGSRWSTGCALTCANTSQPR